jgi:hypothetical protein
MVADGMLTRKRYREVPPRVDYELTDRARELAPVLGELARWGYEWAWGPPRPSERVDVGAIFRLIPGLLGHGSPATGTIELVVSDGHDGEPVSYLVTLTSTGATVAESASRSGDARVYGNAATWVRALSPGADRRGLRISGDRGLAQSLLDTLSDGSRTRGAEVEHESAAAV